MILDPAYIDWKSRQNSADFTQCFICDGRGSVRCPRCGGSANERLDPDENDGVILRVCRVCRGYGVVPCEACKGEGTSAYLDYVAQRRLDEAALAKWSGRCASAADAAEAMERR